MPQSLKVIKNRIKSVGNTQKVTNAMQMVSVAKLNHVAKVLYAIRPYTLKLEGLLDKLSSFEHKSGHPLLEKRVTVKRKALCVITSDNGLCGFYNTGVLRIAEEFLSRNKKEGIIVIAVGKRGYNFFKSRGVKVDNVYLGLNGRYNREVSDKISQELINFFLNKDVDEVWCAHTHFETAIVQRPTLEKILPVEPKKVMKEEYIVEPNASLLLNELIFESIVMKMRRIIIEGFTAEHASRVVAMKSATDSARDLLSSLTLIRNKIRQTAITQEIMEIVSSVEALKG